MVGLTLRIDFDEHSALGPGKARLLEAISETGSIRGAARKLGMSYRRAWTLLKDIEAVMGTAAVSVTSGGVSGGGARLTDVGQKIVSTYRAIEKRASKSVAAELAALARMRRRGGR
jgi:molybdate transport system regulatory protein